MLVGHLHTPEELKLASEHIPSVMQILLQCIQQLGDEDDSTGTLIAAFELLDDLLENPAPVLNPHIKVVVESLLQVAGVTAHCGINHETCDDAYFQVPSSSIEESESALSTSSILQHCESQRCFLRLK